MKLYSIGTQVFRGRAYLYLFCALTLCCFLGLGCDSDKRCTRSTAPDLPRLGPTAWLDLDEDGSPDFVFEYIMYSKDDVPSSAAINFLSVRPLGSDSVQYTPFQGCMPLPDSTLIDGTLGWSNFDGWLASVYWYIESGWKSGWGGPWAGVSEMSLGLQLVRENASYFGWAKLSVEAETGSLTVHDYAYNFRDGLPILAGVHPPLYCTEIGCPAEYLLILRPSDTRFPAGRYHVHVTAGGDATPPWFERSCYFVVSDDPHCVPEGDCNALYFVGYPYPDKVWIQYGIIQGPLEVVVERDGSVVGTATFEPVYEIVYPNGPECPPTCHQAIRELIVE